MTNLDQYFSLESKFLTFPFIFFKLPNMFHIVLQIGPELNTFFLAMSRICWPDDILLERRRSQAAASLSTNFLGFSPICLLVVVVHP